jgi:AcrR family transcriptional regulator
MSKNYRMATTFFKNFTDRAGCVKNTSSMNQPLNRRRTRGPAVGTRDRLLAGTLHCLRTGGIERTTIAAVSRASGVSRPTIYAHFASLDDLIHEAVQSAAVELSNRLGREITGIEHPGDRLVEFVVAAHREFRADPVVGLLMDVTVAPGLSHHGTMPAAMFELSRGPVAAVLRNDPGALARLDEIIETTMRFLLSVLTYRSENTATDDRLRAYLRRALVPALGLSGRPAELKGARA